MKQWQLTENFIAKMRKARDKRREQGGRMDSRL